MHEVTQLCCRLATMTSNLLSFQIEITHRIAWRNNRCDVACCNQNSIDEGTIFSSGGGTLACRQGCSGTIATMSYVCTDVSTSENWAAGQRSYEYNMTRISYFEASWVSVNWSIVIYVDYIYPRKKKHFGHGNAVIHLVCKAIKLFLVHILTYKPMI